MTDQVPVEFTRWLDLTDAAADGDASSAEAILREQELYEAWAHRAELDGVCILCAVQPRAGASSYCDTHQVVVEPL